MFTFPQIITFSLAKKAAKCGLFENFYLTKYYICIPPHTLITCPVT